MGAGLRLLSPVPLFYHPLLILPSGLTDNVPRGQTVQLGLRPAGVFSLDLRPQLPQLRHTSPRSPVAGEATKPVVRLV